MVDVLTLDDLTPTGAETRTAKFEGEPYGAGASFFFVDNDPGQGIGLHWHPYSETWIVLDGEATFRVGDGFGDAPDSRIDEIRAAPRTVVTVPPQQHHGFRNSGSGTLRMMCVHAGPRIIQFDLE
jgi:mannose-6-phosphate isomerase-like protein (cupin superfamily)